MFTIASLFSPKPPADAQSSPKNRHKQMLKAGHFRQGQPLHDRFTPAAQSRVNGDRLKPMAKSAQYHAEYPRNLTSAQDIHNLLLSIDAVQSPSQSFIGDGYAHGTRRVLNGANNIMQALATLKKEGHANPKVVLYTKLENEGIDPHTREATDFKSITPYAWEIPHPENNKRFNVFEHWSTIAQDKGLYPELNSLGFMDEDLNRLKQTAAQFQFNPEKKEHMSQYTHQLFEMIHDIYDAYETIPPSPQSPVADHEAYRVGFLYNDDQGNSTIKDITPLVPGFDFAPASLDSIRERLNTLMKSR